MSNERADGACKNYHHGDLRQALIDSALALLEERGDWEFSLRDLARRAGVSHAAPYKHFADKRELAIAVADIGFARLRDAMASAATRADDPRAQMRNIGSAYVDFAVANRGLFRLMFGPLLAEGDCSLSCARPESGARAYDIVTGIVALLPRAAQEGPDFVPSASLAAWSLVHGLATLILDGRLSGLGEPEELCRAICDQLLDGVG